MPNLNPDQFFHGTSHEVKGDMVLPADKAPRNVHVSEASMGDPGGMSEGDHAFAVRNDERYAWHAANTFHRNKERPRVYEVEPAADMKPGPWNKEHPDYYNHHDVHTHGPDFDSNYPPHPEDLAEADSQHQDEWGSKSGFKIKARHDIMPGRQGTFPEVNWNSHLNGWANDSNHPDAHEARYGMRWFRNLDAAYNENKTRITPVGRSLSAFHDWSKDAAPHSPLRESAGRPQKRIATLFD